ncbi:hypothetical protein JW921_05475 [Candidatus Fermentibacterales bacterium]|nr:hypothetical protein [Candidatus Fermentibacterales bacterium]
MAHDTLLTKIRHPRELVDTRLLQKIWGVMSEIVEEDERIREKAASTGRSRVRYPSGHWRKNVEEIAAACGGRLNFYPSEDTIADCHATVILDAISWHKGKVVRKPLTLSQAIELLIKHTQGWCWGKTKKALVFTDEWNKSMNQWKMNLDVVRNSGCQVGIILVAGDRSSKTLTVINF